MKYCIVAILSRQDEHHQRTRQRDILLLLDITNLTASKELVRLFKEGARDTRERGVFKKVAVIGASGLLKYFAAVVNRFSDIGATLFDTREEALDWLVG